jgi:hypothetical protein
MDEKDIKNLEKDYQWKKLWKDLFKLESINGKMDKIKLKEIIT